MQKYNKMVTFYHDIEQNLDSDADPATCLQTIDGFLEIERKYNISATYNIVGSLFSKYPDMIEKIKEGGHDIAFHSYTHNPEWSPEIYGNEIELCRKENNKILGYRSPRSQWNDSTLQSLWENGFLWNAEKDDNPEPYFIYKNIVRLPIATDDWGVHVGDINTDDWIKNFCKLLDTKKYFGFGTHDFIFSKDPQKYPSAYKRIIELALERKTLTANFFQVTDLYRRSALSEFYTDTGKAWNRDTRALYRTKRFQELIRNETEKLQNPVIADLGSGGGVLTIPLSDVASKIYCVDNSPGMLDDVAGDNIVHSVFGEVTDTTLPADSVDFIVCARVLEYISDPDQVANEIKKIGKIGTKFLITAPAYINSGPSNEGAIPDRLRKYFTASEIIEWAHQIGPGQLIGIHYFQGEPKNKEDEIRYRKIEREQPKDLIPTNWVFIGTLENKQIRKPDFATIPTNIMPFRKLN